MTKVTAEKMQKASRNAKHVSIKAKDLRGLIFVARSQSNPNESHEIRLGLVNGERYWECTCRGYERFQYCKHTFAAVVLVLGIKNARREAAERAERLAASAQDGPQAASEPEQGGVVPAPAHKPVDEVNTQRATVCSVCGRETTYEYCELHPTAPDVETTLDELTRRDREATRELFRRLLDERRAEDLKPISESERRRIEREQSVLIKPRVAEVKLGGFSI